LRAHCRAAEGDLWHFCRKPIAGRLIFEQIGTRALENRHATATSVPQTGVDG
jgi:hypothetical protein